MSNRYPQPETQPPMTLSLNNFGTERITRGRVAGAIYDVCLSWSLAWFIGATRTKTTTNTRAILSKLIVTVVCYSRNVVDLLLMMKTIKTDITAKGLFLTMTILHLLELGIQTVVFNRQTPGVFLRRKVLLVGKT